MRPESARCELVHHYDTDPSGIATEANATGGKSRSDKGDDRKADDKSRQSPRTGSEPQHR